MISIDDFFPNGFCKLTDTHPDGMAAFMSEKEFALLDEQKAFLAHDFNFGDSPAATLYQIMLEAHSCFPFEWYVAPVITQTMACILADSMAEGDSLLLYSWDLLPAAVLLASRFTGISVFLQVGGFPKGTYPKFEYQPIIRMLERVFPTVSWKTTAPAGFPHDNTSHILGLSPFQLLKLGMIDISAIRAAKSALFVVYWSSLRGRRHREQRQSCVKANVFKGIVQLPPALSGGQTYQFALIEMGAPAGDGQTVRMARIVSDDSSAGELSADGMVALLRAPAGGNANARDVPLAELGENLTPEAVFTSFAIEENATPLGDIADILRCQTVRTPVAYDPADPVWGSFGKNFFARDIRQQDLDPITGFVPSEDTAGNYVRIPAKISPQAYNKFILRKNDIVFAFRGAITSLGGVGFVAEAGNIAIPGQIMCIIRARRTRDAIWLFHYLRQPAIREWVLQHSTGAGIMKTLTTSIVADIPIHRPDESEIDSIVACHQNVVAVEWSIRQQRQNMREQILKIDKSFALPQGEK